MLNKRFISFGGMSIEIICENESANLLISELFQDISDKPAHCLGQTEIIYKDDKFHYTLASKLKYTHQDIREFGAVIMSDIIYRLITDNHQYLAIHAALVSNDKHCILMPAASGSGKSSITTWCLTNGFRYHTDEIVIIDPNDFSLKAFTRPVKLRRSGITPIEPLLNRSLDDIEKDYSHLFSKQIIMLPHRLLNADYQDEIPPLSAILFPQYDGTQASQLQPLSPAKTTMHLMSSNVIARNFEDFGFANICDLARQQPAYYCHFRHFDDLTTLFQQNGLI